MAVSYVSISPPVSGDTVTSQASTQIGDLMVVHFMVEQPAGAVTPTYDAGDFTLINIAYADTVDGAQKLYHLVFYMVATSAGVQAFDFDISPAAGCYGAMCVVRGQHSNLGTAFYDEAAGQIDMASADEVTVGSLADTDIFGHACLLFVISDHDTVGNVTAVGPGGYTERYDSHGMMLYTLLDIPVGPVASPTVTFSSLCSADAYAVLIKPGPAEGEAGFRDYCGGVSVE